MSFSDRLTRAADIARRAHNHQTRKGSDVPYLSHLFAVAALVMESGGSEDQVCAALLHDVLEDAGVGWSGEIREELGEHVLALVVACTDGLPDAEGHKGASTAISNTARRTRLLRAKPSSSAPPTSFTICDRF